MEIYTQKGNALFLILIAVALFAALSYAVTQSGRGGSGVDKERAEILAAQLIQEIGRFQSNMLRFKIIYGVKDVLFNDSLEDETGTCYQGGTAITPCHTIGLFNPTNGIDRPLWTEEMRDTSNAGSSVWRLLNRQLIIDDTDVGTSAPDLFFLFSTVDEEVCKAFNRKLHGISEISTLVNPAAPDAGHQATFLVYNSDDTFSTLTNPNPLEITDPGCHTTFSGTSQNLLYVISSN